MYIASRYVSKVFITSPGIGFNQTNTKPPKTTTPVTFPDSVMSTSAGFSHKVVYVEAGQLVSVYVMVRNEHTSDDFQPLPISDDANDFWLHHTNLENGLFIIAALEDNTRIEVQLKTSAGAVPVGGRSYSIGQKVSFELGKLQTLGAT
ncbi:hypothetical protein DPMN_159095 [Dreissena polymorpha]|uniref:Uncharacterized protein n=1 Tax=Dreissena polymorpha TaxID=45954 RepID=A0A9D4EK51_DREPO|nr:hypothetical protein DPMN_159095 [Dreissena polymorpha]